jgi:hypothetical protein
MLESIRDLAEKYREATEWNKNAVKISSSLGGLISPKE